MINKFVAPLSITMRRLAAAATHWLPSGSRAGLAARGWTEESGGAVTLTERGRAAHGALSERVGRTRAVVMQGLAPHQYAETVRILSVMAGNVEAAIAARTG